MYRIIVTLVLFICLCCTTEGYDEGLYVCTAWGDPHVTRFPLNRNDYPGEVWCKQTGLIAFVKNKYVHGSISVTDYPYVTTEFNFVFVDDNDVILCVVNGNQFLSPPAQCGQDVIITKNDNSITIDYRKMDIIVYIRKSIWYYGNYDHYYSIWIWQSACLIKMSTGLCKTSCDAVTGRTIVRREVSQRTTISSNENFIKTSAEKICQIYISTFVTDYNNSSKDNTSSLRMKVNIQNAYNSCVTDLQISGNLEFGKTSIEILAVNSATINVSSTNSFQEILNQAIALANRTNIKSNALIMSLINSTISSSSPNYTVEYGEGVNVTISCRNASAQIIKIISASYEAFSGSCSGDATQRVKELCLTKTTSCEFIANNIVLLYDPCYGQHKKLKIIFRCE